MIDDTLAYAGRYGGQSWPELEARYTTEELVERTKAVERLVEAENKANKA